MLQLTLGRLRWQPDAVWRATPREVAAALGRSAGPDAMSRDELARMMVAHPDLPPPGRGDLS